jgi:hypothetical protein
MYNVFLVENDFDFELADDVTEYSRDYSSYEAFYIDVTKSLYSTGGTTQQTSVLLNNISLTGFDNGFLGDDIPKQYQGIVVANSYTSYTLSGDMNWAYIFNDYTYDYTGYTGQKDLLIEFKPPIIRNTYDSLFFVVYDNNNNYFYEYIPFAYEDGISNFYTCYDNNGSSNGIINSGDTISFYISNNTLYVQVNGTTIRVNNNPNTNNDYRFEFGALANVSGETYTVNDFSIYSQRIVYTGTSNNITDLNPQLTGTTYTWGKTKFKLLPVSTLNIGQNNNIKYDIIPQYDYKELNGGFYQGVFKLYNYPVQYFKTRANKGWTINTLITNPSVVTGSTNYLNFLHPDNSGIIFYIGTRAENKYWSVTGSAINVMKTQYKLPTSGDTASVFNYNNNYNNTDYENTYYYEVPNDISNNVITGITEPISKINDEIDHGLIDENNMYTVDAIFTLNNQPYSGYYNSKNGLYYSGTTYDGTGNGLLKKINFYKDVIDNSFGIFLDKHGNIGYKLIYATDPCYTGTCQDPLTITNNSFIDYTTDSDTNKIQEIRTKYFSIKKVTSKTPIINTGDTMNRFIYLTTIFERDFTYDTDCMLKYGKYKNGTLSIFINGKKVFEDKNCNEIIPHELDTDSFYQEGVPFNISFGGGTQGLINSVDILGNYTSPYNKLIIDEFFSGTYFGGVKSIQMLMVPLDVTEIKSNVDKIKNIYNLPTITGGRYVKLKQLY